MALTSDQILILGVLLATVAMFLWGRWRHDMVAAGALLACVVAGLVPFADAFTGFGHPAVITVACVLVLSQAIGHQNNTLILGPGGFRFGDYWRLGLPLELLVAAVSIPMLLWVWPL